MDASFSRSCAVAVALAACARPQLSARAVAGDPTSLVAIAANMFVDPATTGAERSRLVRELADARAMLVRELGELRAEPPLAIFCKTAACGTYVAGPTLRSRALAPGDRVPGAAFTATRSTIAVVHVDANTPGVIAHELVHLEVQARTGGAVIPAWFDDGVAVLLSGAPDCTHVAPDVIDDLRRVDARLAWETYTNERNALEPAYCRARAEVAAWVLAHGPRSLFELFDALQRGAPFDDAYGALAVAGVRKTPVMTLSTELSDARRPFSLAMWIEPAADTGVLAHLSDSPIGAGYCTPVAGFDASGRLVAQVLHAPSPEVSSYTIATAPDPVPRGRWSHVAITWAPSSALRLYIDGREVATAASHGFTTVAPGERMYLTWGSSNLAGAACWRGEVASSDFDGRMTGMQLADRELAAAEIAELARQRP